MDANKADKLRRLMRELGAARGDMQGLLGGRPPKPARTAPSKPEPTRAPADAPTRPRAVVPQEEQPPAKLAAPTVSAPIPLPTGPHPEAIGRELGNAARTLSLANVSHELRTPLHGVLGMVEALEDSSLDEQQRGHLDRLRDSAEALLATVSNLLTHVEIEADGVRLADDHVSLRAVLEDVTEETRRRADDKGLSFEHVVEEAIPDNLRGDGARLRQVLEHLLGNAVKFTAAGQVRLLVRKMGSTTTTVDLRFDVVDTGVGIPKVEQERLFAPFTQLDSSSRRSFGGAGLGLSISRRLVERMGGRIEVHSAVGRGTEFRVTLTLPLAEGTATVPTERESEPKEARERVRGHRILVVDDNGTNRKVASSILGKLGYVAETADSGEAALEQLANAPFDLVLMDVQMPGMDGLETTQAIRAADSSVRDRDVVIIALTAHTGQGDRQRFLDAGMNDYLPKPVRPDILDAAMAKWLPETPTAGDDAGEPSAAGDDAGGPSAAGGDAGATSGGLDAGATSGGVVADEPGEEEEEGGEELPIFDREGFLERVGGDEELMGEVLEIFLEETPDELASVRTSAESGDLETLRRAAHTVKGAARNVGGMRLGEVAYEIETAARDGELDVAKQRLDALQAEFDAFKEAVA